MVDLGSRVEYFGPGELDIKYASRDLPFFLLDDGGRFR